MHIDCASGRFVVVAPHLVQEFVSIYRSTGVLDEKSQQSVLLRTKSDGFLILEKLMRRGVQGELAESIPRAIRKRCLGCRAAPPNKRFHKN